jgi:hypothetical protein
MGGSMSSVVIYGDISGAITLAANTVAGTNTITVPAQTGTMVVSGPAFSAYLATSNQNVSGSTWTKVQLNTETFDTNNNFDSTTNYRFTPTVAGYYQINAGIYFNTGLTQLKFIIAIYKNGSIYKSIPWSYDSAQSWFCGQISDVISMNGTTDYLELYAYQTNASAQGLQASNSNGTGANYMSGCLIRGA